MKLLTTVWILVIGLVVSIALFYKNSDAGFYGIAESREIVISLEKSVTIGQIHVGQGQRIARGDLLVQLNRPELDLRISEISHELNELRLQDALNTGSSQSQISRLRAEQASRINDINSRIRQLEVEYELNKKLTSQLRSIRKDTSGTGISDGTHPIQLKIDGLKKELELALSPSQIQIDMLKKNLSSSENPLKIQVESMEEELALLREEKQRLRIVSPIDGIIGSVGFKDGENVSPFATILTLHTRWPSYIKGYIHENMYSRIEVGSPVMIQSIADGKHRIRGVAVGVGSRIVEYPVRLRKRQDIQVWGREVIIRIPEANHFLLGEKVMIVPLDEPADSTAVSVPAAADIPEGGSGRRVPQADGPASPLTAAPEKGDSAKWIEMEIPWGGKGLEPSGLVFLKDIGKYLLISDDTPAKAPELYLMTPAGRVEKKVNIAGLDKINDMESIAQSEDGTLYLAASGSVSGKGKIPAGRKLLCRVRRDGENLVLDGKIPFHDLLKEAAAASPEQPWAAYVTGAMNDSSLDIEGLSWKGGTLYLGCKAPLKDGRAVILELKNIGRIMDETSLCTDCVSIWRELDLRDEAAGRCAGISGLEHADGILYITAVSEKGPDGSPGRFGSLWRYDIDTGVLRRIQQLTGLQPEGVAVHPAPQGLTVVFDNGPRGPWQIMKLDDPLTREPG